MTIVYISPAEVPSYIDILYDADGVRFDRDTESLTEVWSCGDEHNIPTEVVFAQFGPLSPACMQCEKTAADSVCCSSHDVELCHRCYRAFHFVEICSPACAKCAREGLDPAKRVAA